MTCIISSPATRSLLLSASLLSGLVGCSASLDVDDRAQAATVEVVLERAPGSALVLATVSVVDVDGAPIVGLDTVGAFHGAVELPVAAVTDSDGAIVFSARTPVNAEIEFELAALGSTLVSADDYQCSSGCRLDSVTSRQKDGIQGSDLADDNCEEGDVNCGIQGSDVAEDPSKGIQGSDVTEEPCEGIQGSD